MAGTAAHSGRRTRRQNCKFLVRSSGSTANQGARRVRRGIFWWSGLGWDCCASHRELVREVRAAGLRGIEIRLNGHANAAADDTVTMPASQRRLHAGDTLCAPEKAGVRKQRAGGRRSSSSAPYGTRWSRRTSKRSSSHSTVCEQKKVVRSGRETNSGLREACAPCPQSSQTAGPRPSASPAATANRVQRRGE